MTVPVFSQPDSIRELTDADFANAAILLAVPEASVRALAEVGTSGPLFMDDGRPTIFYDAQVFHRLTNGIHVAATGPDASPLSVPPGDNRFAGKAGAYQYERLAAALALDETAALQATFWGAYRVPGTDFAVVGFANVQDMIESIVAGAANQLLALVRIIQDKELEEMLRGLPDSSAKLAEAYVGRGYRANKFDSKIAAAFNRYTKGAIAASKFTPPLRLGSSGDAVVALQIRLGVPATGTYDPQTVEAVRNFQRTAKIMEDGIAEEKTHGRLGLPWPPLVA